MTLVFDTEPLHAMFRGEQGGDRVLALLRRVEDGEEEGYASRVTFAELRYLLERRDAKVARGVLADLEHRGLRAFPCEPAWEGASRVKARFPALSLADAFALATAKVLAADLVALRDKELARACAAEGVRVRRP